jgi:hypothetical protein
MQAEEQEQVSGAKTLSNTKPANPVVLSDIVRLSFFKSQSAL